MSSARLRKSGIELIGDLEWGAHFSYFYETRDDLLDILIPYFRAGLENNEFCMWVVFEPLTVGGVLEALERSIPQIHERVAAGDIEVLSYSDWYLQDGEFRPERVIAGWRTKLAAALARGLDGMRVNGNETWVTQRDWLDFAGYEAKLDQTLVDQPMIVLCTYPVTTSSASQLLDVARTHTFVIARRRGEWDRIETPEARKARAETAEVSRELEERVQAEKALAESEAELRSLFGAMTDVVLVLDSEGRYLRIAPTSPLNLYKPSEDLLGKTIHEVLPEADAAAILERVKQALKTGRAVTYEYRMEISQREVWFQGMVSPLSENTVFWIARDITEQKRARDAEKSLEKQLLQAQRLESVGRLAGGVAHDFNNMLGVILGYTEAASMELSAQDPILKDLEEARAAAQRSAELVKQLLGFARQQVVCPLVLDLNDTVSSMLKMLHRLIGEDIELVWVPAATLWNVLVDPSQVDQVLANLMVNARDAMIGVGRVTIRTENVEIEEVYCDQHVDCSPGDYVLLEVSDDGSGMDRDILANIFDPFFTSKEPGKGTGLGLSTVYGIVKQNNGFITVYSAPGEGSTFKIHLPRFEAEPCEPTEMPAPVPPRGGNETILIVEDEEAILKLSKTLLGRLGYTVLTARSPMEAIEVAQEDEGEIHLLLTDVVMPGMNGAQLSERLSGIRPGLKSVFMSGYPADVVAHRGVLIPGVRFMQKPFTIQILADTVRRTLDEPREP